MERIAIATEGGRVAAHFGRCPTYTIAQVEGGQVIAREMVANPGHQPGFLPGYLAQQGVEVIIAGGMGPRAEGLFAQHGIKVVTGASGPVDEVLQTYMAGGLRPGANICDHDSAQGCDR